MKYWTLLGIYLLFLSVGLLGAPSVSAQTVSNQSASLSEVCGGEGRYLLGVIPSWDRGLGSCENVEVAEILEGNKIAILTTNILAIIVSVSALIAVGFIIVGGFVYILSSGNPEQATSARKTIMNALIGLVIVIMGRVVAEIVYNQLTTL